jgi:hypothetical protein
MTNQEQNVTAIEALQEQLKSIADSYVADPEKIAEYLAFATRFHRYSPNNTMLIFFQNDAASFVASYQAWQAQGYAVRRGEKGMKIFVPVTAQFFDGVDGTRKALKNATKEEKKLIEEKKIKTDKVLVFKVGSVFDITQTTVPFDDYPKLLTPGVASMQHAELAEKLIAYTRENICDVSIEMSGAMRRGSYNREENHICVSPALGDTARVSTLTHEIGHALLHRDLTPQTDKSVALIEFEADALSIMMHNELGLEITDERKGHLAEAFRVLKDETDTKARKNMPEGVNRDEYLANAYRTMLVASLKEVHETYSEHVIPIIDHLRGHEPLTQEKAPVTKDRELSR